MEFESPNKKKLLENQNVAKKTSAQDNEMGRREFLEKAGLATAGIVGTALGLKGSLIAIGDQEKYSEETENNNEDEGSREDEQEDYEYAERDLTEDEEKIVEELFSFDKKIDFNMEKRHMLTKVWEQRYLNDKELPVAYYDRVLPKKDDLAKKFSSFDVPENYIYLSIAESYAESSARSGAQAVGPFQFIADTGREYGLAINDNVDERKDLVKSGEACAHFLSDMHNDFGGWNLALYGYNGSFVRTYANREKSNGGNPTEEGFLEYMQAKAQSIKENATHAKFGTHKIRKGQTLSEIARKYDLAVDDLKEYNRIRFERYVRSGQELKIPFTSQRTRKKYYYSKISGIIENINYVPKYRGLISAMEKLGMIEES